MDENLYVLICPDGKQYKAESALKCVSLEHAGRIPAPSRLERWLAAVEEDVTVEGERIKELETALKPFADLLTDTMKHYGKDDDIVQTNLTIGQIWKAWVAIYSNGFMNIP